MTPLTQIVITAMSAIPAVIVAYMAYRASKATASTAVPVAQINTGPGAQEMINAGFQELIARQQDEIKQLRLDVRRLLGYTGVTSRWHVEHVNDFDNPAREIILEVAPARFTQLKLTPFLSWEDYLDQTEKQDANPRSNPQQT